MASHRFILSGGHLNTDGGGARNEINWTYPSVVALKAAIESRGGKAWILQEEDGDSDRTRFPGGLQAGARRCVELAKKHGPFDAYISSHYNGGASPGFHAIFPDGSDDAKADNPLDVKLCRTIRDQVKATKTVGLLSWTVDSPGVMSEKETGVGAKGYRLGEMVGTLGFRDTTARVIIEAGSIDVIREAACINDPRWVRGVYAEAIVNGLEVVFGSFAENRIIPSIPTLPAPPKTSYPPALAIPDLDKFKSGDVNTIPGLLAFGDGYLAIYVGDHVEASRPAKRLRQYDGRDTEVVGPEITDDLPFDVDWLIVKPGDAAYKPVYRTPYGTFVRVDHTNRIGDRKVA